MQIKPVTILCGTNSCGKSSILQSILLIRQTLESQISKQALLLNGGLVHLGIFSNIIFEKKLDREVSFEFSFKITKNDLSENKLRQKNGTRRAKRAMEGRAYDTIRDLLPTESLQEAEEYHIHYKVSVKAPAKNIAFYLITPIVHDFTFTVQALDDKGALVSESFVKIALNEEGTNQYLVQWKNISSLKETPAKGHEMTAQVEFNNISPLSVTKSGKNSIFDVSLQLSFYLRSMNAFLRNAFASLTYIGPLREEPSRRYIYEDEVLEIGVKGENAAYIYLTQQNTIIDDHYFYNRRADDFELKGQMTLANAVQDWLDQMSIQSLKPEPSREIIYLNLNAGLLNETRVNIADVGFGVSQIFPIILEGLRMARGNFLLLEQPEIHLHPKLQMQMADYFLALALSGKKVIAETHSDHIVNRLVRRIVEDETWGLKDLIGIYFVKYTENGAVFEEIQIDDTQGIVNWPLDFFDQAATEQRKIMQAGLKKRRRRREKKKS